MPTQHVIVLTGPKHQECICADSALAPEKPCHQQQLATAVGMAWMCDGKNRQQVSVSIVQLGHMKARKSFALLLPTSTSRLSRLLTHCEDHACQEANQQQQQRESLVKTKSGLWVNSSEQMYFLTMQQTSSFRPSVRLDPRSTVRWSGPGRSANTWGWKY